VVNVAKNARQLTNLQVSVVWVPINQNLHSNQPHGKVYHKIMLNSPFEGNVGARSGVFEVVAMKTTLKGPLTKSRINECYYAFLLMRTI
jgi:hypothetical protein